MHIDMQTTLIAAAGGLLGGIVVAFVNHFFSVEADRQELLQSARRDAYVAWLEARPLSRDADDLEVRSEKAREAGDEQYADALWKQAEQKRLLFESSGRKALSTIATYGGKEVVRAVAEWYDVDGTLKPCVEDYKGEQDPNYKVLVVGVAVQQAMRNDLIPDEAVSDNEMAVLQEQCSL